MSEISASEFPFVQALPKRKQSAISRLWDTLTHMQEVNKQEGGLLPVSVAARALNISRSRVDQLVNDGRLRRFEVEGHVYISGRSVAQFAWDERKNGRPALAMTPAQIAADIARSVASEKS